MLHWAIVILVVLLLAQHCLAVEEGSNAAANLGWPPITRQHKPWTRWWWPGNAVDPRNLSRELEQMHEAGIGGVEITPIYGVQGYDDREIEFLSIRWLEMLRHVLRQAAALDMGVDMATCTGWPFGGPMVTPQIADQTVRLVDGQPAGQPSRMKVKRAARGGAGLVLNPYSTQAITAYLRSFEQLPQPIIRCQFHDSFEYAGNWSDELPELFKQMHGYDLAEHATELFGQGDPEVASRVRSDYRQTLAELHLRYIRAWVQWCHQRGYLARNQAHGAPGNLLDLYAAADIPETETFGSTPFAIPGFRHDPQDTIADGPNTMVARFASSAAHVAGRTLVSCETLTWLREHFRVALSMAKPEIDQMFLAGINHIIYHGTCYSPEDAVWPGWLFYASSEVNPRDTLWRDLPAMNAYIARCQSILQSGWPDNDLLVYFPIFDHWDDGERLDVRFVVHRGPPWLAGSSLHRTAQQLDELGCSFDLVSDQQLMQFQRDKSALVSPAYVWYFALLVPPTRKMPPETLEQIISLAENGANVLFLGDLPADVPGLGRLDERRARLQEARSRLDFNPTDTPGLQQAQIGRGRVLRSESLQTLLEALPIRRESFVGDGVSFIRRRQDLGNDYFIAALGKRAIDGWIPLALGYESVVIMDPLTGRTGMAEIRQQEGRSEVYLQLEPGQSIILRALMVRQVTGDPWLYLKRAGEPVELRGTWRIEFIEGGPETPAPITTDRLASWTELGDEPARRFAGTARYRIEFDRPSAHHGHWLLDLGDVRESARVNLNGRTVGTAWCLPFQVRLSELRERGNVLEIEVTNLAANRLRDLDLRGVKWRIFKEINYVNINYTPFDASAWPFAESGLLGPVRLAPMAVARLP